jgi:hypothetical protein
MIDSKKKLCTSLIIHNSFFDKIEFEHIIKFAGPVLFDYK